MACWSADWITWLWLFSVRMDILAKASPLMGIPHAQTISLHDLPTVEKPHQYYYYYEQKLVNTAAHP